MRLGLGIGLVLLTFISQAPPRPTIRQATATPIPHTLLVLAVLVPFLLGSETSLVPRVAPAPISIIADLSVRASRALQAPTT